MKVKCDHRSKFSNLSNWKEEAWKKSGLQRDSNPWPPRYRCDALPTELWSHTLGARSIYWVHFFPCNEIVWNIYGGHGFESRWSPDFFQASSFQLLKLENLLRWSHFTFIIDLYILNKYYVSHANSGGSYTHPSSSPLLYIDLDILIMHIIYCGQSVKDYRHSTNLGVSWYRWYIYAWCVSKHWIVNSNK